MGKPASTWADAAAFFAVKPPTEKITVPDIGDIWVYGLTEGEKEAWENTVVNVAHGSRQMRLANASAGLLLLTVRNQHGNRLFSEKDMGRLQNLPCTVAEPILKVARRLSALSTGDVEDLVKNSLTLQGLLAVDSGSVSPGILDGARPTSPNESAPES
jgi:hypothetical protein